MYFFISFLFTFYLIYYFVSTLLCLLLLLLSLCFFGYIFYITYASKERAACIIVPYNDGSKAPTRLSGRRRSRLAFTKSGMFWLDIAPKEKLSCLFNPVSIQEFDLCLETWLWSLLICTGKTPRGSEYTGLRERIQLYLYVCS